jgi:hypothetical protein
MLILVFFAIWTALAHAGPHAGCSGDADCNYNGRCVDATCTCDPQFHGCYYEC